MTVTRMSVGCVEDEWWLCWGEGGVVDCVDGERWLCVEGEWLLCGG